MQHYNPIQIKGILARIIFQKDSFLIGCFEEVVEGVDFHQQFIALGSIINPQINLEYILTGRWEDVPRYGSQFKFSSFETIQPSDTNGIYKYIVRICKFVGPTVGTRIVEEFGEQTLDIMKADPEMIATKIKGITFERAKEIQITLLENESNEKLMVELESLLDVPGVRKNLPAELIKKYKSNAAEAIKNNPYILTEFHGIGFPLADRVALHIGYARDGIERKKAATLYCMKQNMKIDGNVWIRNSDLINKIREFIQVPDLSEGIYALIDEEVIVSENGYFALAWSATDESYIAEKVLQIWRGAA